MVKIIILIFLYKLGITLHAQLRNSLRLPKNTAQFGIAVSDKEVLIPQFDNPDLSGAALANAIPFNESSIAYNTNINSGDGF